MTRCDICVYAMLVVFALFAVIMIAGMPVFAVLAILKAAGVIDWHWAAVCVPIMLWTPCALAELLIQTIDR